MNTEYDPIAEAENYLLGMLMVMPSLIPQAEEQLVPNDFQVTHHKLIYRAILASYHLYETTDPHLTAKYLADHGDLNRAFGPKYIYDLFQCIVETENFSHYLDILSHHKRRKQIAGIGSKLQMYAADTRDNLETIYEKCHKAFLNSSLTLHKDPYTTSDDLFFQLSEDFSNDGVLGIPSGYPELDLVLGGFQPGDLIIIAARPSIGKSALCLNLMMNMSIITNHRPIGLFSLEMPAKEIALRAVSCLSEIPFQKLEQGAFEQKDIQKIIYAMYQLKQMNFIISDVAGLNISQFKNQCRRMKAEHPDLLAIYTDYLQLFVGEPSQTRNDEVGTISRGKKVIAMELGIPVIACAQLNREVERRPDKRPKLPDLRDSGNLEQDTDVVAFLHRDDYYDQNSSEAGICEVIIGKNRNGPNGTVKLGFDKEIVKFYNL